MALAFVKFKHIVLHIKKLIKKKHFLCIQANVLVFSLTALDLR